jgi:putative intracellular protease/amidase
MGSVPLDLNLRGRRKEKKMKRFMIILATILSAVMFSTPAITADAPKILLILRDAMPQYIDTMLTKEVVVMKSMFESASFKVVVATTDGLPIKGSTVTLTPNLKLSDVKVDDYVGVIIACSGGGSVPYTSVSPIAVSIAKQSITQGKPVAASHGSVIILAEAGVLVGKRYAFWVNPLGDDRFTGAIYGGIGVVQDGNIITCGVCPLVTADRGLPDCTTELTQALITALSTKK